MVFLSLPENHPILNGLVQRVPITGGAGGFGGGGGGGGGGYSGNSGLIWLNGYGGSAGTGGFGGGGGGGGGWDQDGFFGDGGFGGGGGGGYGGGIFIFSGTLSLINSTIACNSCFKGSGGIHPQVFGGFSFMAQDGQGFGGGIYNYGGSVVLLNTIVAGNIATTSSPDLLGSFNSLGNNLIGNNEGASGLSLLDFQNVSANLEPLQYNGGLTPTCAELPDSLSILGGTGTGAPLFDQRGISRPPDAVDIGAFQFTTNVLSPVFLQIRIQSLITTVFPQIYPFPVEIRIYSLMPILMNLFGISAPPI